MPEGMPSNVAEISPRSSKDMYSPGDIGLLELGEGV